MVRRHYHITNFWPVTLCSGNLFRTPCAPSRRHHPSRRHKGPRAPLTSDVLRHLGQDVELSIPSWGSNSSVVDFHMALIGLRPAHSCQTPMTPLCSLRCQKQRLGNTIETAFGCHGLAGEYTLCGAGSNCNALSNCKAFQLRPKSNLKAK